MAFVLTKLLQPTKCVVNLVRAYKVAVLGGTSELGQSVSLLLRAEPCVSRLTVHDAAPHALGVAQDLSHIPSASIVNGYSGEDNLRKALQDVDIILVTGGVTQTHGMQKQSLISANADFIRSVALQISLVVPMPFVGIATEPINAILPMAAEFIKHHGNYDPRKLFGITGLDALRAQTMYAEQHSISPHLCSVPVICGHSGNTVVPLLSQATPATQMSVGDIILFTKRFRKSEYEIIKANKGSTSTLATAHSVLLFTREIIRALNCDSTPVVQAFVENNDFGTGYFAGRVEVTYNGAGEMQRYTNLSEYECDLLEHSINTLRTEVSESKKILETI